MPKFQFTWMRLVGKHAPAAIHMNEIKKKKHPRSASVKVKVIEVEMT